MGQAKQRGTFQQRKDRAMERNVAYAVELSKTPNGRKFIEKHGPQQAVTRLVMAGFFAHPNK